MKKYITHLIIVISIVVSGCATKHKIIIDFEHYNTIIETTSVYKEINKQKKNGIIKYFLSEDNSGSLLIAKKKLYIHEEADYDLKNVLQKLPGSISYNDQKSTFLCNNEEIEVYTTKNTIKKNDRKIYLHQTFFVNEGSIYSVSLLTDEKKIKTTISCH